MQLTTHCLMIFVGLDSDGRAEPVTQWIPRSEEDIDLDTHARHLVQLRTRANLLDQDLPRAAASR
jgi:acyl-CoA hydrolase